MEAEKSVFSQEFNSCWLGVTPQGEAAVPFVTSPMEHIASPQCGTSQAFTECVLAGDATDSNEDALWVSQVAGPAAGDGDGQQAAGDAARGRRDAGGGESAPQGAGGAAGQAVLRRPYQHPVHLGTRRRPLQEAA